jgi:hypothetical protein
MFLATTEFTRRLAGILGHGVSDMTNHPNRSKKSQDVMEVSVNGRRSTIPVSPEVTDRSKKSQDELVTMPKAELLERFNIAIGYGKVSELLGLPVSDIAAMPTEELKERVLKSREKRPFSLAAMCDPDPEALLAHAHKELSMSINLVLPELFRQAVGNTEAAYLLNEVMTGLTAALQRLQTRGVVDWPAPSSHPDNPTMREAIRAAVVPDFDAIPDKFKNPVAA